MTSEQLLQQALEEMENINRAMPFPVAQTTIKAIRAHLAQPQGKPLFADLIAQHDGLAEELAAMDKPQGEPVYWQWRKKGAPWALDKTLECEVFVTTDDTEVRPLYAAPQAQPESKPMTGEPAWHPAPTVPGVWVAESCECLLVTDMDEDTIFWGRWYGPIPQEPAS